jgi:hypothetical protein
MEDNKVPREKPKPMGPSTDLGHLTHVATNPSEPRWTSTSVWSQRAYSAKTRLAGQDIFM